MDTDTPRTDEAFRYAYDQASPEHGEGWDSFAEILRQEMSEMEREINEMTTKQIELVNHLNLYRGQINNERNNHE
jgi:hypothetical protein